MKTSSTRIDPITLEVFHHRFSAIAEEMGTALRRSAFSPNIKERQDYSCALFDGAGEMVAQAAHIPVHLGSTPLSVRAAIEQTAMRTGDVVILNDPYAGGTHLPDVTVVAPVFVGRSPTPAGYIANRAHHADIGGATAGSMALATEIYQEGLRLPPVHLVRGGELSADVMRLFTANTRVPDERRGDLLAQVAALRVGEQRLRQLIEDRGGRLVGAAMAGLQDYSERLMRAAIGRLPRGTFRAVDWLDDDGFASRRLPIRVAVDLRGESARIDFRGSAPQAKGGINANRAVTVAAVLYVFQLLAGEEIPASSGLLRPLELILPEGTVVDARFPAAVAAGNVETSQRIVDVLLKALAKAAPELVPASSCGTMNNLTLGGFDSLRHRPFAYYETIAGGAGAGPGGAGASAVQTHMTNTLNTPVEALEAAYPLRVVEYRVRRGSGGKGRHRGGDGVVRTVEVLGETTATLLSERREIAPPGAAGGGEAKPGENRLLRQGRARKLPAKVTLTLEPGERLQILTPGGGGWGRRSAENQERRDRK